MMLPRHHTEIYWHLKFVTNLVTNCIVLIIKLISTFGIFDVGDGKKRLAGESRLDVKAKAIEECASPCGGFIKP